MSDGMGRELAYLSSHATNRYFIPNWGTIVIGLFEWLDRSLMESRNAETHLCQKSM